jgi:hypothetical protein
VLVIGVGGNLGPSLINKLFVRIYVRKPDFKLIAVLTAQGRMRGFATVGAEEGIEAIGGSWISAESYKSSSHLSSPVSPLEIASIKVSEFDIVISLAGNLVMSQQSSNNSHRSRGWRDAFLPL